MVENSRPATGNFLSSKLTVKPCPEKNGHGVFAVEPVEAGEVVAVWGGRIVSRAAAMAMPENLMHYIVQVEDDQFLAPLDRVDPAELINHCCHPNCGLVGQITLVALRRIEPGEEATFDYATTDSSPFLEMDCACENTACRKRVCADDWRRADVQAINRGHFSPYLQRRIDAEAAAAVPMAIAG